MKYSPQQYAKALHDLVEKAPATKHRQVIRDFLATVARNDSLKALPEIIREFQLFADAKAGMHQVVIRTPERLPLGTVEEKLPFKAKVTALVDVRLQGGVVLEVDDLRIDNSVANRLERAQKAFTK